jgi:dTDP-4-dehydrorhamnose reductase
VASIKDLRWGITGGSGQLAKSLVNLLNQREIPHIAWSRADLDISDLTAINKIKESKISVLVNCAAWTDVDGAEDETKKALLVNKVGAENVALAARELEIPLVHISTDYVFSGNGQRHWKVNDDTVPTTQYGMTKLMGEEAIRDTWPDKGIILRTAWLYGPYGKNFAKTILRKILSTKDPIRVVNDQLGQPTSTVELAKQILRCIDLECPPGTYHATNSGEASWWKFASELANLCGVDGNRIQAVTSKEFASKAKRPTYSVLDLSDWDRLGIEPMQDWRGALVEIFPEIQKAVEVELQNG